MKKEIPVVSDPMMSREVCTLHSHHRLSWSAVVAGALVGVGLGFLLHLFGVAIGLTALSSNQEGAIIIGGALGVLIGVIVSMGVAGYVAGYLGRFSTHCHLGIVYGFTTWSLSLFLAAALAAPVTNYVTAYTNSLSKTVVVKSTDNKGVSVNVEKPATANDTQTQTVPISSTNMAWGAWMIFVLFFIGALSSCIGAHCGMSSCKRSDDYVPPSVIP